MPCQLFSAASLRIAHRLGSIVLLLVLAVAVPPLVAIAQEETATPPPPPWISDEDVDLPCTDSRLRLGDIADAQDSMQDGVDAAEERAEAWQSDVRLYTLRLGCPLLEPGYQWDGTFFSEAAQSFYSTDTGMSEAAENDPDAITTLDVSSIDLSEVYRSLQRAGFDEDVLLSATGGVTIRTSTDEMPFGPPSAPRDAVYIHVALEERGEVIDIWVSADDGTVYRYER